ncbi:podocalyxin-like protein 2 [Pelodytes ibericus]
MLQPWHLYLGCLFFLCVSTEDPSSEGLSSTSLLDLAPSYLRGVDTTDHEAEGYQEPDVLQDFLRTPQGSGFSSQETEETSILQSPQFWGDDEEKPVNDSSRGESEVQTGYSDLTTSYGTSHEEKRDNVGPLSGNLETSTSWWSTDSEEVPRQASPDTRTLAEEKSMKPTPQDEEKPPSPEDQWTVPTSTSTVPAIPVTKSSRKNRKHSASRNHHSNYDLKPQSGHPGVSQSLPAGDTYEGHRGEGDKSVLTHSVKEEDQRMNGPKQFIPSYDVSTQGDLPSQVPLGSEQVICNDWINLSGRNYVILNMSDDINCEQFKWQKGQQLLSLLEEALSLKEETPQKDWVISLSKPNENDNHLLMTITEEQRVVPIKDVFSALGDIKRSLAEIGIESYSSTVVCESRPNQPRSDYGKLFIVLVIIGSICVMIIIAGIIYICWQRRLPKLKNMELHFVENGCHDNPTLDVAMDAQSEMQEKKTSLNGGTAHRADGWETLINKESKEDVEVMEEDTHL